MNKSTKQNKKRGRNEGKKEKGNRNKNDLMITFFRNVTPYI
jgi:hypothetical protein